MRECSLPCRSLLHSQSFTLNTSCPQDGRSVDEVIVNLFMTVGEPRRQFFPSNCPSENSVIFALIPQASSDKHQLVLGGYLPDERCTLAVRATCLLHNVRRSLHVNAVNQIFPGADEYAEGYAGVQCNKCKGFLGLDQSPGSCCHLDTEGQGPSQRPLRHFMGILFRRKYEWFATLWYKMCLFYSSMKERSVPICTSCKLWN